MSAAHDPQEVRSALESEGYYVFPSLFDRARCEAVLGELALRWEELGRPPLHARRDVRVGPEAIVSPVGLAFLDHLVRRPDALSLLLPPPVHAAVRAMLGDDFLVENVAAVLADESRPFFLWHHHLGGILDARIYRRLETRYPVFDRVWRLACTFYPVPLDEEHGVMLVRPRALGDPSSPESDALEAAWPSQRELRCPAGSVVLLEQSLWHAVTPMTRPGHRAFVAGFLVAQQAPALVLTEEPRD